MASPNSARKRQIHNSAFIAAAADASDSRCDAVIGAEGEGNKSVDADLQIKQSKLTNRRSGTQAAAQAWRAACGSAGSPYQS